ncbi:hypothetical protein F4819DRAFT_479559 [Hypoxylon fuscum]|nr:hypothetical protein F4819DRAFT_479559 [Hypoxylon fuscum]
MASPIQKLTRRPHAKTRTGCRVCKSRKVKCDETRPSCRNCIRRGVSCDFNLSARSATPNSRAASSSAGGNPIGSQTTSPADVSINHLPTPTDCFGILDLELLHHFTTSTCFTFSAEPMVRNFWRVNVPRIGFSYHYVLKGILSLAALHLARYKPERREMLTEQAMVHHNAASSLALPALNNLNSDDSVPMFFFSMLTAYISLGSPKESDNLLVIANGAMPEWLFLFRGMRSVIDLNSETIHSFLSMGVIFNSGKQMSDIWEGDPPVEHEGLKELETTIKSYVKDPQRLDILLHGIDSLRRSFGFFYGNNYTNDQRLRGAIMWLFKLRDEFVNLLKERDSEAMCILAFFCVLLQRLDNNWWIEGWGVHLVGRIYSVLDDRYRLWIRWPIEEIGWVP